MARLSAVNQLLRHDGLDGNAPGISPVFGSFLFIPSLGLPHCFFDVE
jgi:hypothetical protein